MRKLIIPNRINKINNSKQSPQNPTCSRIPTNHSTNTILSIKSSTNLIIPIFTTAEDAVVVVVADVEVAAVAATDFANTSIVGRTDCAVTTEENAVTPPKVIKLMRLLRIAWGAIHIM